MFCFSLLFIIFKFRGVCFYFFVFRSCSSFLNSGGSVSILVLPLCFMLSSQLLVQEKAEVAQGFVAGYLKFLFIIVLYCVYHTYIFIEGSLYVLYLFYILYITFIYLSKKKAEVA